MFPRLLFFVAAFFSGISDQLTRLGRAVGQLLTGRLFGGRAPDDDYLDQDEDQQLQRSLKQQEAKDQLGQSWVAGFGRLVMRLVMRPVLDLLGFGWSFSTTRGRGLFLWGLPLLTGRLLGRIMTFWTRMKTSNCSVA